MGTVTEAAVTSSAPSLVQAFISATRSPRALDVRSNAASTVER